MRLITIKCFHRLTALLKIPIFCWNHSHARPQLAYFTTLYSIPPLKNLTYPKETSDLREGKWNTSLWSDVLTAEFTTIHRSNAHGLFSQRRGRQQDAFWRTLLICPDLLLKAVWQMGIFPIWTDGVNRNGRSSPWDEVWEKSINLKLQVDGPLTRLLRANSPKHTLTGSISWLLHFPRPFDTLISPSSRRI